MTDCNRPYVVGGIVAAGVASVRLTLGSGATVTVAAPELPAAFGGRRALGGQVPAGAAVRDAVALDASGLPVAGADVGLAPAGQCSGNDGFSGNLVPVAPPPGA